MISIDLLALIAMLLRYALPLLHLANQNCPSETTTFSGQESESLSDHIRLLSTIYSFTDGNLIAAQQSLFPELSMWCASESGYI